MSPGPDPRTVDGNGQNPPRSADADAGGFAVEDVLGWCEDCGRPLSPSDPPSGPGEDQPRACPHCLRPYDPAKPDSFRHAAPPPPPPWWLAPEAIWGYAALLSILIGRVVLNLLGGPFFHAAAGGSGGTAYDSSLVITGAAAILAVILGVGLVVPWTFVTVYLVLIATEHLGEGLPLSIGLGIFAGVVLFLGLPSAWLLAGGILGAFAGLVKRWRELKAF